MIPERLYEVLIQHSTYAAREALLADVHEAKCIGDEKKAQTSAAALTTLVRKKRGGF